METEDHIGLFQLQERIKESIEEHFSENVWLCAEISEISNRPTGHCYLTLIEKEQSGNSLLAKASAIIWASTYRMIAPYFETTTGTSLSVGMNILVKVQVHYSELYGLSLIIYDIDPSFTLGEFEIARQKTIIRLKEEGMFEMNTSLTLPQLPRRFAVISAESAAGYRDFMRHLHENEYGFTFETTLFPSLMQGNGAPKEIIDALEQISQRIDEFDAVLIMRGGGGAMDLICFDDYDLAVNVAQFPLPILTGIGHDHDYHVIDMVAYANVKTPTALADYIIDIFAQEDYRINSIASRMQLALKGQWQRHYSLLERASLRIKSAVALKFSTENNKLQMYQMRVNASNPRSVLSKGFSIALKEGKKVSSIDAVETSDMLTIMLSDGNLQCIVKSKNKIEDE